MSNARSTLRILPAASILLACLVLPTLVLVQQSLFDLNPYEGRHTFVGLANYVRLLYDTSFLSSIGVTAAYSIASSLILIAVATTIAAAMASWRVSTRSLLIGVVPFIAAPTAVSLVFLLFLDGQVGFVPQVLRWLGFEDPDNILGLQTRAFWSIVLVDVWQWIGVFTYLITVRLKKVDQSYRDLVAVSGGRKLHCLLLVTLPAASRFLLALFIFKFFWNLGDAEKIDAITAGGAPHGALRVFAIWIERTYFRYADFGYGAAATLIVLALSLVALRLFVRLSKSGEEFQ